MRTAYIVVGRAISEVTVKRETPRMYYLATDERTDAAKQVVLYGHGEYVPERRHKAEPTFFSLEEAVIFLTAKLRQEITNFQQRIDVANDKIEEINNLCKLM